MPPQVDLLLHALWIACALVTYALWRQLRERSALSVLPIGRAQPGAPGRFRGRTAALAAQRSPIADAPSIWFDWKIVQTMTARGESLAYGDTIVVAQGTSREPFAIDDESGGRIIVWPENAEVRGADEQGWQGEIPRSMNGALRDQLPESSGALSQIGGLDLTERRLRPGVFCSVTGRLEASGSGYGPEVIGLIREGIERQPLVIAVEFPADVRGSLRAGVVAAGIVTAMVFVVAVIASILA